MPSTRLLAQYKRIYYTQETVTHYVSDESTNDINKLSSTMCV